MKWKCFWIVCGLFCLIFVIGCSYKYHRMQTVLLKDIKIADLQRDQYIIIGDTIGFGCAEYVGLWPIPIWWISAEKKRGELFGGVSTEPIAERVAMYNALEKMPEADAIIAPRFHRSKDRVFPWFSRSCVTVKGKAIQIKSDTQLSGKPDEKVQPKY